MNVTMAGVLLLVQLVMALILCWSCLCRVTKTNGDTRREVRWAMCFEGSAAGLLFGAPFLPALDPQNFRWEIGTTPVAVWLVLLVSILAVQLATAKYWRGGVPKQLQDTYQPASSMAAFGLAVVAIGLGMGANAADVQAAPTQLKPPAQEQSAPVVFIPAGAAMKCAAAEGCIGMSRSAYVVLAHELRQEGAAGCGKTL